MKLPKEKLLILTGISLALTNIWIMSFQSVRSMLLSMFPVTIPTNYYEDLIYPKPFDIPVYVGLTAICILSLPLITKFVFPKLESLYHKQQNFPFFLISASIFLALLLAIYMGSYPMVEPFMGISDSWVLYIIGTSLFVGIELLLFTLVQRREWLFWILSLLIIAFMTFEPGFQISWFDYTYMLGPAYEVLHGKTMYLQIPSQYGFLLVYALAFIMKIINMGIFYLPLGIWILYIFAYFSLFFVMVRLTKSALISTLFLISLLTINYFSLFHLPIAIPQITPLRFLLLWFGPILMYATYFNKRLKYVGLFVVALFSLWVIDAGIESLLAVISLEGILVIKKIQSIRHAVLDILFLLISTGSIFLLTSLGATFLGYKLITPSALFSAIHEYAVAGFGMEPLPSQTFFWIFMLVFFFALLFFFIKQAIEKADIVLVYSSFLFFFASFYYIGRSHPHNIFHISVLFLFSLFLLFSRINKSFSLFRTARSKIIIGGIIFILFVFLTTGTRQQLTVVRRFSTYADAINAQNYFQNMQNVLIKYYKNDIIFIQQHNPQSQALIVSPDDTALLMLSGKSSQLYVDPMNTIVSSTDLSQAFPHPYVCPQQIFVATCILKKSCAKNGEFFSFFIAEDKVYAKTQQLCNNRYKTTSCSNHLCMQTLASSSK